jgi:outer membrane lipoprotein SlyB
MMRKISVSFVMLALVLVGCEKNNNSSESKSTSPIISLSKGDPFRTMGYGTTYY